MDIRTKLYQMFILGTEGGGYNDALKNGLGGMIFLPEIFNRSNSLENL